jgi:hypothetical protein
MAVWHGKVILAIDSIPSDWYSWHGAKLEADYLLIKQKLLDEITTLEKVVKFQTLVIYSHTAHHHQLRDAAEIKLRDTAEIKKIDKKLSTDVIWLRPGMQKMLTWSIKQ